MSLTHIEVSMHTLHIAAGPRVSDFTPCPQFVGPYAARLWLQKLHGPAFRCTVDPIPAQPVLRLVRIATGAVESVYILR
jgi:hypothetical protein